MFSPFRVESYEKKKDPRYISGVVCNMGAFLDVDTSVALSQSTTQNVMGFSQAAFGVTKLADGTGPNGTALGIAVYNVIAPDAVTGGYDVLDMITGSANQFYDRVLGQPITIFKWQPGDEIVTDQILPSGTGALVLGANSGNTAEGTLLAVTAGGVLRVAQSGDKAVGILRGVTYAPTTTLPVFNTVATQGQLGAIVQFI